MSGGLGVPFSPGVHHRGGAPGFPGLQTPILPPHSNPVELSPRKGHPPLLVTRCQYIWMGVLSVCLFVLFIMILLSWGGHAHEGTEADSDFLLGKRHHFTIPNQTVRFSFVLDASSLGKFSRYPPKGRVPRAQFSKKPYRLCCFLQEEGILMCDHVGLECMIHALPNEGGFYLSVHASSKRMVGAQCEFYQ